MVFFDDATIAGLDRFTAFHRRRELRRLQRILWKEERVVRVLEGRAEGQAGVLALTTDRLIWVSQRRLRGTRVLPLREVRALRCAVADDGAVVSVETDGIALALQAAAEPGAGFAAEARSVAQDQGNPHLRVGTTDDRPVRGADAVPDDVLEAKLERLARMHRRGSMTTEEYRIARDQLLRAGPRGGHPDPPSGSWWRRF